MKRRETAFTLIELLVVIAIIGLLASIVLVALNSARAKSRDAKRIADIKEIQSALELYFSDNGQYPYGSCESTSGGAYSDCWSTLLPGYVGTMPNDPLNVPSQYGYYYGYDDKPTQSNCYATTTHSPSDYILATRLENPASVQGSCPTPFYLWDNSNLNYIVGM